KGRTTLCKNGPGRIRAVLYMAAIVATKYNPDIKIQYERLLKAGKTKMQALGAAMRKLVQICFGVLKHQSEYRSQAI
ncbi:IS110 family transposase, partial [Colwellia sp. MB02u-9]|nr:IS110 family transposase [Colwellia sp. MB02u-9]